ncbi:MAG: hypothetical protein HYX27_06400 [Acidobacteria bacterium]|nr:hypothetical protein [Acidobacteriota bacterium]
MRVLFLLAVAAWAQKPDPYGYVIRVPKLERAVTVDGHLAEWKDYAFSDGVWDIARLRHSPWYDPVINRLTVHGDEPGAEEDLAARYYIAWDERFLYLGADVKDNANDVTDPAHEPKRWYYKDAICWFIEAPQLRTAKKFGEGDNAFCFVIDTSKPAYGAWWRHGARGKTYLEEPLPKDAVQYAIRRGARGDFVLEARVAMAPTLGVSSPDWHAPRVGDTYSLEIVHTDPDGGDYGGHFLIYGRGDDDSTWGRMELTGPQTPIERKPK